MISFAYKEKDTFIHKLHPASLLIYTIIAMVMALISSHPAFLLSELAALGMIIICSGNWEEWKIYLKISFSMGLLIILVNGLFGNHGTTEIIHLSGIPVIGKIAIQLETIVYGIIMSIRLIVMMSAFCLYTYAIHPDKALKMASKWGKLSAITITLTTRLIPVMLNDLKRITEVQKCRGLKLDKGNLWRKVSSYFPIISVLILSSLERSWQMAESMEARGFGSGPGTLYSVQVWRKRDTLVSGAVILSFIISVTAACFGWSAYTYYPNLQRIDSKGVVMALFQMVLLMFPVIISWGWKKWPALRSKI